MCLCVCAYVCVCVVVQAASQGKATNSMLHLVNLGGGCIGPDRGAGKWKLRCWVSELLLCQSK